MSKPSASSSPPAAPALTGKATRHLRGLGHDLAAVISVGKQGIADGLVTETSRALLAHELIKVKVQGEAPLDRKEAAEALAAATGAALAQVLGRTFLLYKRHPKQPKIVLPVEAKKKKGAPAAAPPAKSAARPPVALSPFGDDDGDDDGDVTDEQADDEGLEDEDLPEDDDLDADGEDDDSDIEKGE